MSILIPRFPRAVRSYDERNEAAFRQELEGAFRDLARLVSPRPVVRTEIVVDGSDRDVTHTVVDPLRQFVSLEYSVDGGAWSSSWTTEVTRSSYMKTVTLTAGLDSTYEYRMGYKDENGQQQYTGETLPLTHLRSVTKTLRWGHSIVKPGNDTRTWLYLAGVLTPNALGTAEFYEGELPIPKGITIDTISARMYRAAAGDLARLTFSRTDDTGGQTTLATLTHNGTGVWQTKTSASLSELVGSTYDYTITVELTSGTIVTDARFRYVEIAYTMPSYDKAY